MPQIKMYFSKSQNGFVKIAKCICLSARANVLTQPTKLSSHPLGQNLPSLFWSFFAAEKMPQIKKKGSKESPFKVF